MPQPREQQQLHQLLDRPPTIKYHGTNCHNSQLQHTNTQTIPQMPEGLIVPLAAAGGIAEAMMPPLTLQEGALLSATCNVSQWGDSKHAQQRAQDDGVSRVPNPSVGQTFLFDHVIHCLDRHTLASASVSGTIEGSANRNRLPAKLPEGQGGGISGRNDFYTHQDTLNIPEPTPLQEGSPQQQHEQRLFQNPSSWMFQHHEDQTKSP